MAVSHYYLCCYRYCRVSEADSLVCAKILDVRYRLTSVVTLSLKINLANISFEEDIICHVN